MKHTFDPFTRCCDACGATRDTIAKGQRDYDCPGRGNLLPISGRIVLAKQARLGRTHKGRSA